MKKQVLTLLMASLISGTAFAAPGTVTEKTNVLETTVYGAVQDVLLWTALINLMKPCMVLVSMVIPQH